MEPQSELLLRVKEKIEEQLKLNISRKELAEDGQVYIELGAGYTEKKYVRGPSVYIHPILFICKSSDEGYCLDTLSGICNLFKRTRKTPAGETYSGMGLQVAAEPNKIGRQEDGQVLYSCIINYRIMY